MCNLSQIESNLNFLVKGQSQAISRITSAVIRAELGFKRKGKLKAGMIFLGPTGVGKTEFTLSLSKELYGGENRIKRFDMAEFQLQESLRLLLGSNKYEQGLLGDAIDELNKKGGGILLFDEVEKAHKSLNTIFLSALDVARITMANGETKDLSDFYLIFTSNLGGANASEMSRLPYVTVERYVLQEARDYFSSELFARFDETVVFKSLDFDAQLDVCKSMLSSELEHLSKIVDRSIKVQDSVFHHLLQKGYSRDLGARMMSKTIERELGDALARWKLRSDLNHVSVKSDNTLEIEVSLNGLVVREHFF